MLVKSALNWLILPPTKVPVGPVSLTAWVGAIAGGGAYCEGGISWALAWFISSTAPGTSSSDGGAATSSSESDGKTYSCTPVHE